MHIFPDHQQHQVRIINEIDHQAQTGAMAFSTVDPVSDYDRDQRMSITSVHFPHQNLIETIYRTLTNPLKKIDQNQYYYPKNALHMTIKNVRVINDPPHYTPQDIETVRQVFDRVAPKHHAFHVYFYKLILFPHNLGLIGTTDSELDDLFLELDRELTAAGVADDKKYANSQYFFSNITIARFTNPITQTFRKKIEELASTMTFDPYLVDSVTEIVTNASLSNCTRVQTFPLITF